jgi:hypothetical protein
VSLATVFKRRFTALLLNVLFVSITDGASMVPIAPPHAEHAVAAEAAPGHVAALFWKKQELTASEPDANPMAPPVCAVLLKKLQSITVTMLPFAAEIAPPTPPKTLKLAQF